MDAKYIARETKRLYGKGYCTLRELAEGADTIEKRLFASVVILHVCKVAGYTVVQTAKVMQQIKKETGFIEWNNAEWINKETGEINNVS